jgi:hypothetical protein
MKKDPNEWINLAENKKYRKVIKNLSKYIPVKCEPLSKYSAYDFNPYFKEKSKAIKLPNRLCVVH